MRNGHSGAGSASASGRERRRRRRHERGHPLHRQQDQPYLQGGDPLRGHPLHYRHRELYRSSRQRYAGAGLGYGAGPGAWGCRARGCRPPRSLPTPSAVLLRGAAPFPPSGPRRRGLGRAAAFPGLPGFCPKVRAVNPGTKDRERGGHGGPEVRERAEEHGDTRLPTPKFGGSVVLASNKA